jgi:hypothetical protein
MLALVLVPFLFPLASWRLGGYLLITVSGFQYC